MLSVSKYILLPLLLVQSQWSLADPVISEFLASNDSELADADGDFSDWIEIYNPDPIAVNMAGWHLTDDDTNLTRWTFPSVTIPAGGYLVVFASNKGPNPIGQELHTDFKLSSDGEYLALVKPNGITTTSEFNPFPAQNTDISYGLNASVSLLAANAPLHYTLSAPALDSMGKAWTAHDFDDSSWISMSSANSNYSSQDVPKTARKPNWSNSAGTATSTTTIASQNSPVSSVKLRFNISRTAGSSLTVSLRSPQGTSVNVFSNGSNANNFSIDLTQFNNETLNGEWTLTLTESGGNWWSSNQSTLNSWSLEIPNGNSLTRSGIGYDTGSTYNSLINTQVPTGTAEMWLRFPFQVADSSTLSSMLLKMRYDDGFEAFINGTPVASANITSPIAGIESDGYVDFDLTAFTSSLQDGDNILAIRVVNSNTSSSDFLCLPELTATGEASATAYALLPNPTPGLPNQGGALNPGPVISEVAHSPNQPTDGDNLLVTANVQPRQNGIASVNLIYRVNYASEVSIAMLDDGTGADAIASDGVYSASIPAAAANPGQMLRWKIQAQDNTNLTSTLPLILDTSGNSQSPEYYGTLIAQPSVEQGIPVMHWFTQSESNSRNRTGARASVYYEGVFYDNIYVRQRGGFTNNGSQKFDFNKGHPFNAGPQLSSVGEVNMNGNGNDSSYVRQPLGFQFHQAAGNPGCTSFPVHMRLNGSFDRIGTLIEQVDEDFLKRYGYDHKDGELYKLVQRSNLNPVFHDTSTGVEKKTGNQSDFTSLQNLVDDLKQSNQSDRITSFYDNIDVPEFTNYMAIRAVQQQADDVRKNFYVFKDSDGDGRWRIFPWDLDFTWDIVGGHGETRVDHPFFGIQAQPTNDGNNQWNRLYDVAYEDTIMQRLMLRRLRTLMDNYLKPSPTGSWFNPSIDTIFSSMSGLSGPSNSNKNSLRDTEVPERRNELFNTYTSSIPGLSTVIPASQPSNPAVSIDAIDFDPSSGDQDQEYIRITNAENTEIDISGWSLSTAVDFVFPAGTVIPRNGEIFVSPKLKDFVLRTTSPTAEERNLVVGPYAGHLSSFGEDIVLKNDEDVIVQTYSYNGSKVGFTQWLDNRGQTDPIADEDNDGWNELLTYGLGIDLAGSDFEHGGDIINGYLTLTSTVRNDRDVDVIPQISNTLTGWVDAVIGTDVILVSETDNGDGTSTVVYRSANLHNSVPGGKEFIRLAVRED